MTILFYSDTNKRVAELDAAQDKIFVTINALKRITTMNIYQRFALNHYLTAYPEGAHYLDVLDAVLRGDNEEVVVCGIFADMPADFMVAAIRHLCDSLQETFTPISQVQP